MVSQEPIDRQSAPPAAGRPAAGTQPLLLVDAMLGKLARWLRLAGHDAEFWREGSDEALMAAAAAADRLNHGEDEEIR